MRSNYWLVFCIILTAIFLFSCQKEIVEKEDRLIIDIDSIEDIDLKTNGINIYKTCKKGKEFSKKNLEVLLRGWNEVMEELKNPSSKSSLFKKNRSDVMIWNETWSDFDSRNEFETMWQELYEERWSNRFNKVLACDNEIEEITEIVFSKEPDVEWLGLPPHYSMFVSCNFKEDNDLNLALKILSTVDDANPAIFSNSHRYNFEITDGNRLIFLDNKRFDFIWSNFWLNNKERDETKKRLDENFIFENLSLYFNCNINEFSYEPIKSIIKDI